MTAKSDVGPRLVVVVGTARGAVYPVPAGRWEIGRDPGVAISLNDAGVSRTHAVVESQEGRVTIRDLGSTNGSWINRQQVSGWSDLHDGDLLQIGSVTLRFDAAPMTGDGRSSGAAPHDQAQTYRFGDVDGPVQVGGGQQFVAGRDQYAAGRDQYWDNSLRLDADYDPWDELFSGTGVGRVLMALGGIAALAGFGLFMYTIFTADPTSTGPGPLTITGFAVFGGGGILASIGGGMSKAARKRQERNSSRGRQFRGR